MRRTLTEIFMSAPNICRWFNSRDRGTVADFVVLFLSQGRAAAGDHAGRSFLVTDIDLVR